jgi:hypothetical protein
MDIAKIRRKLHLAGYLERRGGAGAHKIPLSS